VISGSGSSVTAQNISSANGSSISVASGGALVVTGAFQLGSGSLVVSAGGSLNVSTFVLTANSSVTFTPTGTVQFGTVVLNGLLTFEISRANLSPGRRLLLWSLFWNFFFFWFTFLFFVFSARQVVQATQVPAATPVASTQTFVLATYGTRTGQWSSVSPTLSSPCETISSSSVRYASGSATLSVTLQPTNAIGCPAIISNGTTAPGVAADGGLSTGAIVGIVVGSVAAVVVLMVVLLFCISRRRQVSMDKLFAKSKKINTEISMSDMRQNPSHQNNVPQ
jgi:hypothetical protein